MKYIFDLDETLIESTTLNNDAYNYALEKYGYERINARTRITREKLTFIPLPTLQKIIKEKQKYFTREWLPYRTILNKILIAKINQYGKNNCFLWTKACQDRVRSILMYCRLDNLFNKVIFDAKIKFHDSIQKLKEETHSNEFIIYENNYQFFEHEHVEIIDHIKTAHFDVKTFHVCC